MHAAIDMNSPALSIRREREEDHAAVQHVNDKAFGTQMEANLVNRLRVHCHPFISLVAEFGDEVVGHIMFTPVALDETELDGIWALAPMAVLPEHQGKGIGAELVRAGLEACREQGAGAVIVVGHPGYYPRFGFVPASRFGLECEYDVPDEVFMALELRPGFLDGVSGLVRYHPVFNEP